MSYKFKDDRRAHGRAYYQARREEKVAYQRNYNQEHREDHRAYNQARREENRAYHQKHRYGITWEDKMAMFLEQDGKCLICGKQWEGIGRNVHTDHCHRRGVVRGLLCTGCNNRLGHLEAYMYNLDGTKSAINKYLMKGMDM